MAIEDSKQACCNDILITLHNMVWKNLKSPALVLPPQVSKYFYQWTDVENEVNFPPVMQFKFFLVMLFRIRNVLYVSKGKYLV